MQYGMIHRIYNDSYDKDNSDIMRIPAAVPTPGVVCQLE